MKLRCGFHLLLVFVTMLSVFSTTPSQTSKTPKQAPAKPTTPAGPSTVIFAVNKYDADNTTIDPVAVFSGGRFINPTAKDDQATLNQFAGKYLRAGQKHRLIFGGAEAGSVTVKERYKECICLTASVDAQTTAKLGGEVRALATTSDKLGGKQSSRRAPTPEERAAVINLAKQAFKQNKVAAGFLANIVTTNLTALDLDGDGKAELVGSFEVKGYKDTSSALFLIAEPQGADFKIGLSWYKLNNNEETNESRRLVDQLDIDGDGIGEVVAQSSYYESTDFTIYKKVKGVWRSVYKGGMYGV
jgi:hypothetical protein